MVAIRSGGVWHAGVYYTVLFLHSWLRWLVLLAALVALVSALMANPFDGKARKWQAAFTGLMDLQFLLGILLYAVLSPVTKAAFAAGGAAMKDAVLRFWMVEHIVTMVLALGAAHMGSAIAKKALAAGNAAKAKKACVIGVIVALVLMLAGIPWPGRPAGRPLVPAFPSAQK